MKSKSSLNSIAGLCQCVCCSTLGLRWAELRHTQHLQYYSLEIRFWLGLGHGWHWYRMRFWLNIESGQNVVTEILLCMCMFVYSYFTLSANYREVWLWTQQVVLGSVSKWLPDRTHTQYKHKFIVITVKQ